MIAIGQEGIRLEERKDAAELFAQRMTERPPPKQPAKPADPKAPKKPEPKDAKRAAAPPQPAPKKPEPEPGQTLENLVIILEPNASRFEMHYVDPRVLSSFLNLKFNVLMFNYVGFDSRRAVQPSLQVRSAGDQAVLQVPLQDGPGQVPGAPPLRLRQESGGHVRGGAGGGVRPADPGPLLLQPQ